MSETKKHREFLTFKNLNHSYNFDEIPVYRDKDEYIHTIEYGALLEEKQKVEKLNMQINKLIYVVKEIHSQACQHDEGISSLWLENMTQDILKEMGELK